MRSAGRGSLTVSVTAGGATALAQIDNFLGEWKNWGQERDVLREVNCLVGLKVLQRETEVIGGETTQDFKQDNVGGAEMQSSIAT